MTTKIAQSNVQQDNISIDWLSDVDTVTAAPTTGQALVWDTVTSKWIPGNVVTSQELSSFLLMGA